MVEEHPNTLDIPGAADTGEEHPAKPIRMLVVEDSEDDALLIVREMRRGGYDPAYTRVDTPEDLARVLHDMEWDIVISDYLMPRFSGIDAFQSLRGSGLDIPFIMVSGKIGEETAVEAMRTGVHDYIMKDNLHRLVPAVERELQEAEIRRERRKAEEQLRGYRERLEDLVRERTAELTREIEERTRIGNELRESEERYRTVSELITDYAYSYRVEQGFKLVREWLTGAFERITGYSREEMETRSAWSALVSAEDIDRIQRPLTSLLSSQTEVSFEYRILTKAGEVRWLREYAHSLWNQDESRVTRIYGAVQDITDRKRAEDDLRESELRYRVFADNTYDWEFWLTPEGKFLYTSPSCRRITGHDAVEFTGNPDLMIDIVYPDDRSRTVVHRIEERQKEPGDLEFRIIFPDGSVRWLAHVCQPVSDEKGNFLGTRGSNRDITKRRELEEKIAGLRTEYEAFMRHEIKNLFLPVQHYAEALISSGEPLTQNQREQIEKIRESTAQAFGFIDALKQLHDIESGSYPIRRINYPLKDIVEAEIFRLRPFAAEHEVTIVFDTDETAGSDFPLDMSLMPGVFSNLIRNAVEHVAPLTDPAERLVTVGISSEENSLIVKIHNRGPTLSPERVATFFEKFNPGHENKPDGIGLGTTYAYLVTKAHGGDITIESSPEAGTTVTLVFPVKPLII